MTTSFLDIDGVRLEYTLIPAPGDGADKPTLVLLHEGLGSIAMWRDFPQAVVAATGCPALVYSRRGYGQSDPLAGPRAVDYMHHEAQRVLPQVLTTLKIANPVLVGHSDGASISLIYAGSHVGPVAGVVAMAPHVFVEEITVTSIAQAREVFKTSDLEARLGRYHRDGAHTFWGWNDIWLNPAFRDWNIEDFVPKIAAPILVIQGNDDEYGTRAQCDSIASHAKVPCTLAMLDNCRHSPHRDQPEAARDAIAAFVASVARTKPVSPRL
jgi:pimeloyl-ACP methyl ester carboxylesterase